MKSLLACALVVLTFAANAACPTATPDARQFHMTASRACTAAQRCLDTQTLTFTLVSNTSCYPSWYGCPGYTIQACDTVTWDFGDGSAPVVVKGQSSITHRFTSGRHQVRATVQNVKGSAYVVHDLHIGMSPATLVSFAKESYAFNENDGVATVQLVRSGDLSRRVPLLLECTDLPLVPARMNVVFEPGETSKTIALPILNDATRHAWYPAWVWIYQDGGEAILKNGYVESTLVTIADDDEPVVITPRIENTTFTEGEGITPVTVGIHLSAPQSDPVRLIATIADGLSTARWGSDWQAQWTEIEILPGQTDATYSFMILGDRISEPTETLVVYLDRSTNPRDPQPVFSGWPLTLTILDDDAPTTVATAQINPSTLSMERGTRAEVFFATQTATRTRVVRFTSSNPNIVSVTPQQNLLAGYTMTPFTINAVAAGTATITGRLPDGVSASMTVTVIGAAPTPPVPTLTSTVTPSVKIGATQTSALLLTPGSASRVTLKASRAGIVDIPASITLSASGKGTLVIRGVKAGTTEITATTRAKSGQTLTTKINVTVIKK